MAQAGWVPGAPGECVCPGVALQEELPPSRLPQATRAESEARMKISELSFLWALIYTSKEILIRIFIFLWKHNNWKRPHHPKAGRIGHS